MALKHLSTLNDDGRPGFVDGERQRKNMGGINDITISWSFGVRFLSFPLLAYSLGR